MFVVKAFRVERRMQVVVVVVVSLVLGVVLAADFADALQEGWEPASVSMAAVFLQRQ